MYERDTVTGAATLINPTEVKLVNGMSLWVLLRSSC
jgi:hypothetical protein